MAATALSNTPHGGLIVAVDGPSGTGKSSTCRRLAELLDAKYLDTGAMYRVATLAVLRAGIDPNRTDSETTAQVVATTKDLPLGINDDPAATTVLLAGDDVSQEIRGAEVTHNVSAVSAIGAVRDNLVALQREMTTRGHRMIVEGRDIGTVVLPDAPVKIFLTAKAQVRAQRRFDQDIVAGRDVDFDTVLADVIARDEKDSSRATSPLRPAEDAHIIDTSDMSLDQVIDALVELVKESAL